MNAQKKLAKKTQRRIYRVRNKFRSKGLKPRISISRSLKNISAQIIDDANHKTLASFSTLNLKEKVGDKTAAARFVGTELGKKAQGLGITEVFFDRGGYLYHGRVQALADGLREGGLKF